MAEKRYYRAAGGVVLDDAGRVLLLERDVVRDGRTIHEVRLPKGKLDPGETDAMAAQREVGEESGYWDLRIVADLGEHRSQYNDRRGRPTDRDEHYFLMRLNSDEYRGQDMDPDAEEALFEPLWAADLDDAIARLTYEGEQEFAQRAKTHLNQHPQI